MKLLVTTGLYPPEIGGPATYTRMIEEHLPALGHEVSVLPFSAVRRLPKIIRHIAYFFLCLQRGFGCDVIFAQDPVSVGLPSMCAAKLIRKKYIIRMPGDYAWEQSVQRFGVTDSIDEFQKKKYAFRTELLRSVQRFVTRQADRVITPSRYFGELVVGWGIPARNVVVIYNGIDLKIEPALPTTIPEGHCIISAGRLVPWKGFALLIQILRDLQGTWSLIIIGEGPERENLEQLAIECGVSERVRFVGKLSREEVFGWYQAGTVFALNTSFESFSFQIVEALACKIPVVTTNIGSIPELIENGEEGVLVSPDDIDAFICAIASTVNDEKLWEKRINRGKEKAQEFSIEATTKKLSELLQTL